MPSIIVLYQLYCDLVLVTMQYPFSETCKPPLLLHNYIQRVMSTALRCQNTYFVMRNSSMEHRRTKKTTPAYTHLLSHAFIRLTCSAYWNILLAFVGCQINTFGNSFAICYKPLIKQLFHSNIPTTLCCFPRGRPTVTSVDWQAKPIGRITMVLNAGCVRDWIKRNERNEAQNV